jgi:hypothetical protein
MKEMDKAEVSAIKAVAAKAEIVLAGVLEQLGPPSGAWSGLIAMYQEARYRNVRYLKSPRQWEQRETVTVFHPVVARSRTAAADTPALNATLFHPRAPLVLFIRVRSGRLETFDENYGVLPAEAAILTEVSRALR